jgi:hypothetical protein
MKKYKLIALLFFLPVVCFCQKKKYRSTISADSVLIGEPVILRYYFPETDYKSLSNWKLPAGSANAKYSLLQTNPNRVENGETCLSYTLTSFDTGKIEIPSFPVAGLGFTNPTRFYVKSIELDSVGGYRDIKPIIEPPDTNRNSKPYLVALAILIVLTGLFFYIRHHMKKRKTVFSKIQPDPYSMAMAKLAALGETNFIDCKYKKFFYELDCILKNYCTGKQFIRNPSLTNEELKLFLNRKISETELCNSMLQQLQLSNFVQFAKYEPPVSVCRNSIGLYKLTIHQLEQNNHVV